MLGDIPCLGKRRQFCDEKPRKDPEPVFMATGRPQDSSFHGCSLGVHHEWRSYLVEFIDKDVGAAEQPADRRILPQRAHDHPRADAGKQLNAFRFFQDGARAVRHTLQRRCNERRDDLVYRLEVIVERTICDVRLLGDVVDDRAIDSLAPKNEFGRSEDGFACPLASPLVTIGNGGRVALDDLGHRISRIAATRLMRWHACVEGN